MKNNNKNRKLLRIQIKNEFNKLKVELLHKYIDKELTDDIKKEIGEKSKEFIMSSKIIQRFFSRCRKIKTKAKLLESRDMILLEISRIKTLKPFPENL